MTHTSWHLNSIFRILLNPFIGREKYGFVLKPGSSPTSLCCIPSAEPHTQHIVSIFRGFCCVCFAINTHHYYSCLGSGSKPPPALLWVGWLMHPNPPRPHSPLQCLWQLRNAITDHNEEWNQLHHYSHTWPTFNLHNWRSAWMFFRRCLWSWCTVFGYKLNLWDDSAWTVCSYQRKFSPSKKERAYNVS